MGIRSVGGLDDSLIADLVFAVADVVAHRIVEQESFLGNDSNLPPERGQADLAEVHAVDEERPFCRVVEAGNEIDEGRLTGAAAPHKSQHLAGPDLQ